MKTQTIIAMAAAMLLSGAAAASAASMQPRAGDALSLSRHAAKDGMERPRPRFQLKVRTGRIHRATGAEVPTTVKISAVPSKAARTFPHSVPMTSPRSAARCLIVNPSDRMVAEVISG